MKSDIVQYCRYNLWANGKIVSLLEQIDPSLLDAEGKSSFSSVRKTVFHIWGAETLWLERLNGVSRTAFPQMEENWPPANLLESSQNMLDFAEKQQEDFFTRDTVYKNLKGEEFRTANHGIIMHCMNHSTFHRGQIVTMLRELGVEKNIPATDMIVFLRP